MFGENRTITTINGRALNISLCFVMTILVVFEDSETIALVAILIVRGYMSDAQLLYAQMLGFRTKHEVMHKISRYSRFQHGVWVRR